MLTSELSSYVLEIPNGAYTTLSQNLIAFSKRVLQADWLILENDEKATLNISMPYCRTKKKFLVKLWDMSINRCIEENNFKPKQLHHLPCRMKIY